MFDKLFALIFPIEITPDHPSQLPCGGDVTTSGTVGISCGGGSTPPPGGGGGGGPAIPMPW